MKYRRNQFPIGIKIIGCLGALIILVILYKEWFGNYSPQLPMAMEMALKVQEDDNIYHGSLKNIGFPQYCLDSLYNKRNHKEIGIRKCPVNLHEPPENQNFAITKSRYLRRVKGGCIEGTRWGLVQMTSCKDNNKRLYWTYDPTVKLLFEHFSRKCLEIDPKEQKVYLMSCDPLERKQKWEFTYHNAPQFVELVEYSDNAEETLAYE